MSYTMRWAAIAVIVLAMPGAGFAQSLGAAPGGTTSSTGAPGTPGAGGLPGGVSGIGSAPGALGPGLPGTAPRLGDSPGGVFAPSDRVGTTPFRLESSPPTGRPNVPGSSFGTPGLGPDTTGGPAGQAPDSTFGTNDPRTLGGSFGTLTPRPGTPGSGFGSSEQPGTFGGSFGAATPRPNTPGSAFGAPSLSPSTSGGIVPPGTSVGSGGQIVR